MLSKDTYNYRCRSQISKRFPEHSTVKSGKTERLFQRSMVFCTALMSPLFLLQFFASPVLAGFGIPAHIAAEVGVYCRLMVATAWMLLSTALTVAEPFLLSRMIGNRGSHRRQVQDGHVPAAILYLYPSVDVGVVVEA